MALGDLRNEYQEALGFEFFQKTPKSVFAALALSLAQRLCEDNTERAITLLREEWRTLHTAGIIPQKPIKEAR